MAKEAESLELSTFLVETFSKLLLAKV